MEYLFSEFTKSDYDYPLHEESICNNNIYQLNHHECPTWMR